MKTKRKEVRVAEAEDAFSKKQFFSIPQVCYLLFPDNHFPVTNAEAVRQWLRKNKRQDNRVITIGNRAYRSQYNALYNRNPPRAIVISRGTVCEMMADKQFISQHQD